MGFNTECSLCSHTLTPSNTKQGFGVVCWRGTGAENHYKPSTIALAHELVCLDCVPRANEINKTSGVLIHEGEGLLVEFISVFVSIDSKAKISAAV